MKKIFTKCILLLSVCIGLLSIKNYAQMPPHPSLLDKINRGEQAAPYVLSNLNLLRSQGVDEAWTSPGLTMRKSPGEKTFSRTLGPDKVPSGSWKALAILVRFTDKPSQVNGIYFDNLLFGQGEGTVRDYYNKVSYGSLDIVTVNLPSSIGWVTAPQTYSYYVNGQNGMGSYPQNTQKLVEDVVSIIDPKVDFSQYDNDGDGYVDALFIIHSGRGAEYTGNDNDIWSHAWITHTIPILDGVKIYHYSIEPEYWLYSGDMTCGVFAHELGHAAFGLPDLYDTDQSSQGLGNYSLMAGGSWNGPVGLGSSPAFPDAWSHSQMGYVTPTIVSSNITGQTINNVENTAEAYFLQNSLCGNEYFLVENRQKTGYDTYLPGSGLCIYHIDNSVNNNNHEWYPGHTSSGHYHVALEQADGKWSLEHNVGRGDAGDPYAGSSNNISFDNSSIPDSKIYNLNETYIAVSNILSSLNYTMTADFYIQESTSEKITITYPVGGEVFAIGSNPVITYNSTGTSGHINLDYSTNGGITWNIISTNQPDNGSYNDWTIPNTPSMNCKIRISDVDGYPSVISKGLFIIPSDEFTEQTSISLIGLYRGCAAWGDYDNDGDLDILITGCNDGHETVFFTKIYRNNGDNTFTEQTSISLPGVYEARAAWGDYNNDGYLDILLTGGLASSPTYYVSKIYRNNGDNSFTEQTSISLTGVDGGSAVWGDYDNDGFLDILLNGSPGVSKIYHNNKDNTFTEQTSISLTATIMGSAAWGDYDNDAYLDILLTGYGPISKLYRNNADNTFTEQTSISLAGVGRGATDWGDYDNDGYLDILLTGNNTEMNYSNPVSKIYHNNGDNTFTEQTSISLTGVSYYGSTMWGDYDNDGDLDILLTGNDGSSAISKIYRNNGNNSFTETSNFLTGVSLGSCSWGDYDNDGDLDVLIMGFNDYGKYFSKIYRNNIITSNTPPLAPANLKTAINGNSVTFSWDKSTDNETLQNGLTYNLAIGTSPGACDILSPMSDLNTGKRRIVSMGNTGHCNFKTIKELSAGNYYWTVQAVDNAFAGSNFASIQSFTIKSETITITYPAGGEVFAPGDNPVITYTSMGTSGLINIDYSTDGGSTWINISQNEPDNGDYHGWIVPNTPSTNCKIRISDVDGFPTAIGYVFAISPFKEQNLDFLNEIRVTSVAWGDYDNDGDLDILLNGSSGAGALSKIYRNNGDNSFSEHTSIQLTGTRGRGSVDWGDYDNDGYLDILLSGLNDSNNPVTIVYHNNHNNTFTEELSILFSGSASWGDYDDDGDMDILLTGSGNSQSDAYVSKIYRNDGDNTFTEQTSIPLIGVSDGTSAWGDYDNDGYLDILLTGYTGIDTVSKIYHNNGNNSFTELTSISLTGAYYSSVAWGDYDNDGFIDILLTGFVGNNKSKIYHNNGGNTFEEQTSINLTSVGSGSVAWGDYDNDGYLDILLIGMSGTSSSGRVSKIYRNNRDNTFTEQMISLTGVNGSVAWGDYDNDGDLDFLLTGLTGTGRVTKIYLNNNTTSNSLPTVPYNLKSITNGNNVTFSWDKSTDSETPQNGLTYNLIIGTSPGSCDILSPMSDRNTGYRRIVSMGNAGHCNSKTIKNLPDGKYYWSVQSIDNVFAGSNFASTQSFTIKSSETITITYPAGGEILTAGSNPLITYNSIDNSGSVNLDYSINGGITWLTISTNEPDDGDYHGWIVPNTPSTNCKIRISDVDGNPTAISNVFTILQAPETIIITYPRGGDILKVGSNPKITYSSIDNSGIVNLDYTTDGGTTWNVISTEEPDDGDYNGWIVPEVQSTNCKIRVIDADGNPTGISEGLFSIEPPGTTASVKVLLQGPYSSGSMSTTLNTSGILQASVSGQPYNTSPWNYAGTESISSDPNFFENHPTIVDWVLLELRTTTEAVSTISRRAAFLRSDGSVIDLDGTSPVEFWGVPDGSYYIVARHRNHLAVMSSDKVTLPTSTEYDFTTGEEKAYVKPSGSNPMIDLGGGKYGMWGGDANADGLITGTDFNVFNPKFTNAATGYEASDWNLDGQVTGTDFNVYNSNFTNARSSQVP